MAGFGSLAPSYPAVDPMAPEAYAPAEDWRDREAQAAIAAQEATKQPPAKSWHDTLNDVAHFPHRMFGQLTSQPASPEADQAAMMPETFVNPLVKNTADAIGGAVKSGVTLPGDVATGKVAMVDPETGHTSETAIERAFDTASLGGASVAGTAENAARSAGRDARVLGRKIGGDAPVAAPSELAAPYHAALEGAAPALLSDSGKPGAVIAAADHAPPFSTAAEPALERIARKNGTPEQWRNDLAKYGVTKEEMATRGLDDLKPGQPLSKEQLAAHIESNPVEIKPVVKQGMPEDWKALTGDQQYAVADRFRDLNGREPMNGHVLQDWYEKIQQHSADGNETALDRIFNPPRYADYQLPGGANYRERLLTLPEKDAPVKFKVGAGGRGMSRVDSENFRGDHWGEPNVVVHRRSTDREMTGPEGEKIKTLHDEEQQSDWMQNHRDERQKISKAIDEDFDGIADRMVKAGIIKKVCD